MNLLFISSFHSKPPVAKSTPCSPSPGNPARPAHPYADHTSVVQINCLPAHSVIMSTPLSTSPPPAPNQTRPMTHGARGPMRYLTGSLATCPPGDTSSPRPPLCLEPLSVGPHLAAKAPLRACQPDTRCRCHHPRSTSSQACALPGTSTSRRIVYIGRQQGLIVMPHA